MTISQYFRDRTIEYLIWECIAHKDISYTFVRKILNFQFNYHKYDYMMYVTFSEYLYFILKVIYKCKLKNLDIDPNDE